ALHVPLSPPLTPPHPAPTLTPYTTLFRSRARPQAEDIRRRRTQPAVPARGAALRAPLRRGMVDGHSVDRLPARLAAQAGRADRAGEVCRVHDAARPEAVSRPAGEPVRICARLALYGGGAPRRGTSPAHAPD